MASMFTLAPAGHATNPAELEASYKCWSTYRRDRDVIYVRSNNPNNAGGQTWTPIARRTGGIWRIESGRGYFAQGCLLLARHLVQRGERVRTEHVRAATVLGRVVRYKATAKVYSLPSILNGYKAIVSRDKLADQRAAARKVDIAAAMAARKKV